MDLLLPYLLNWRFLVSHVRISILLLMRTSPKDVSYGDSESNYEP